MSSSTCRLSPPGGAAKRKHCGIVREHLEELVIKPVLRQPGQNPEFPAEMSTAQRAALLARIEESPEDFVAQEQVELSTAPTHTEAGLAPRHIVLRVFAMWNGHSYTVMPGGLTRVSTNATSLVVSMQMGGGSKDTWVLCDPDEPEQRPGSSTILSNVENAPPPWSNGSAEPRRRQPLLAWPLLGTRRSRRALGSCAAAVSVR